MEEGLGVGCCGGHPQRHIHTREDCTDCWRAVSLIRATGVLSSSLGAGRGELGRDERACGGSIVGREEGMQADSGLVETGNDTVSPPAPSSQWQLDLLSASPEPLPRHLGSVPGCETFAADLFLRSYCKSCTWTQPRVEK